MREFSALEWLWKGGMGGKFWGDSGKAGILEDLGPYPWEGDTEM